MTRPNFDIVAKQLRGPLSTTHSGLTTWARMFVADGRFYIAESDSRGNRVRSVTEYPMPEGDANHGTRKWGEWSWKQCTCSNGWHRHSVASLLAMVTPTGTVVTGAEGIDVPAGDLASRLAWIATTDDMSERKARAEAVYLHESETDPDADLADLDSLLNEAVYAPSVAELITSEG